MSQYDNPDENISDVEYWRQKCFQILRKKDELQFKLDQVRFDILDFACGWHKTSLFFRSIDKQFQPGDFKSHEEAAKAFGWSYLFEEEDTTCIKCGSENAIFLRFGVGLICEDCKT